MFCSAQRLSSSSSRSTHMLAPFQLLNLLLQAAQVHARAHALHGADLLPHGACQHWRAGHPVPVLQSAGGTALLPYDCCLPADFEEPGVHAHCGDSPCCIGCSPLCTVQCRLPLPLRCSVHEGPVLGPTKQRHVVQSWRISATGVVVGADASPRVVKKLKLVGEPFRSGRVRIANASASCCCW